MREQTIDSSTLSADHVDRDLYFERDFIAFVNMACDGMEYGRAADEATREVLEFQHEAANGGEH